LEIKRNNRDGTAAPALQRFQYQTVKTLTGCDVICPLSVFFHMDAELLFALQISGKLKFFAQGKGQRGLGLIPAGVYHYVRSISDDIDRMDLQIEINKGQKSKDPDLDRFLQGLFLKRPVLLQEDAHRELFALLRRIQQSTIDEGSATFLRQEWLKALCLELVLMLGTAVQTHAAGEISTAFESTDLIPERYIMDQFFNHNYHGNSDMGMLAGELHMSVRQTGRLLQKTYGKGFREKMNECRLAVALDLIKNTAKSMSEISETLGYGGPTNFSAFIKRQTGKTPAQIRKEM